MSVWPPIVWLSGTVRRARVLPRLLLVLLGFRLAARAVPARVLRFAFAFRDGARFVLVAAVRDVLRPFFALRPPVPRRDLDFALAIQSSFDVPCGHAPA